MTIDERVQLLEKELEVLRRLVEAREGAIRGLEADQKIENLKQLGVVRELDTVREFLADFSEKLEEGRKRSEDAWRQHESWLADHDRALRESEERHASIDAKLDRLADLMLRREGGNGHERPRREEK